MKQLIIILLLTSIFPFSNLKAQKNISNFEKKTIDSINNLSYDYIASNPEHCRILFLKCIESGKQSAYESGIAKSMSWLSLIYYFMGQTDQSAFYSIEAIKIYEKNNLLSELANEYGELGYRLKRRDMVKALYYMQKGINIAESIDDSTSLSNLYDNYGVLHEMNNNADSAFYFYNKSLHICEEMNDSVGMGYSLFNIANLYVIKKEFKKAEKYWKSGLSIRKNLGNKFGLAESYSVIAGFHFAEGSNNLSIEFYNKALEIFKEIDNLYYQQYCYGKLSEIYEKDKDYKKSLEYHKIYLKLRDSLYSVESNAKINELEIRFQTEKKDKDLALQRVEISNKELKVKRRTFLLITTALVVLFLIIISAVIINKQRFKQKKLIRESILKDKLAEEELKNKLHSERMRISRDLHDNLGSHLSFIISSVENILFVPDLKKEKLNKKLTDVKDFAVNTIANFRDTIWALSKDDLSLDEFKIKVLNFIEKARKSNNKISVSISENNTEEISLNSVQGLNLFRIIQEAINNSLKYSGSKKIEILFNYTTSHYLEVIIKDYGSGFNIEKVKSGNGLKNMRSRVNEIGGQISFDTEKGTCINIKFKLASVENF